MDADVERALAGNFDFLGDVIAAGGESQGVLMMAAPYRHQPYLSGCFEQWKSGCGWLRICVFLAGICRDLHR
jgi:hypothetical protein